MVTAVGLAYVVGVTVLFFFWAYGIYAFGRDLRRRFLPALRLYLENRRDEREQGQSEDEREELERQLY